MNIIKNITQLQLSKLLLAITGTKSATITSETDVKMNKTNNPYFGKVKKQTKTSAIINFDYESSVNRGLQKEGKDADFVVKKRAWGQHIPGTSVIIHKGKLYLESRELSKESIYIHEDKTIDKSDLSGWLPVIKKNENQGLENEVIVRDYALENIIAITIDNIDYYII